MHETYINEIVNYLKGINRDIDFNEIIDYYIDYKKKILTDTSTNALARLLLSELNYDIRSTYKSSELNGFKVKLGDICYIDFGKAYISEAGFQHFGIVIGYCNSKALVVPMSSNLSMYNQSYCAKTFKNGKRHLYRLPPLDGLRRKSVLFLNDVKYINTARIIDVRGNVNPSSKLFLDIISRINKLVT